MSFNENAFDVNYNKNAFDVEKKLNVFDVKYKKNVFDLKYDLNYSKLFNCYNDIYTNSSYYNNSLIDLSNNLLSNYSYNYNYGYHVFILKNIKSLLVNKILYNLDLTQNTNNDNKHSRIYLQKYDGNDCDITQDSSFNFSLNEFNIIDVSNNLTEYYLSGSNKIHYGFEEQKNIDNSNSFIWLNKTDDCYIIEFNEVQDIKLTLSNYFISKLDKKSSTDILLNIYPITYYNINYTNDFNNNLLTINNLDFVNNNTVNLNQYFSSKIIQNNIRKLLYNNLQFKNVNFFKTDGEYIDDNNLVNNFNDVFIINNHDLREINSFNINDLLFNDAFIYYLNLNEDFFVEFNGITLNIRKTHIFDDGLCIYTILNYEYICSEIWTQSKTYNYQNIELINSQYLSTDNITFRFRKNTYRFFFNHITGGEIIHISDICFYKDTIIKTDQEFVEIQNINKKYHTINNRVIKQLITSFSDDLLVCFSKNSIGYNKPNKDLIVSGNHEILYNNRLIPAYKFVNDIKINNLYSKRHSNGVKFFDEKCELYNILLDTHEIINANNLECESMNPDNLIGKVYNKYKNPIVRQNCVNLFGYCKKENKSDVLINACNILGI